ncbi:hypothetical protein CEXT_601021 [Caerostris extrusa]|uniref:Uncharacterized protein n=1 Tax=Caerostris extrusa TaxID=172846 RepID=A0AAV4UXB0_CAEEX|nr:hypothetical protein CEXT_601021 [Caerostris extrusa]
MKKFDRDCNSRIQISRIDRHSGDPSPAVRWLRNAELLDDSYYITLKDSPVTNCYYPASRAPTSCPVSPVRCPTQTCPAPVTSTVVIDMNQRELSSQLLFKLG